MSTLIGEEIPLRRSLDLELTESHQLEGLEGEIWRILMASKLRGFGSRISIPLFTGHLTSTTGGAL
jgi:hypothetical protein